MVSWLIDNVRAARRRATGVPKVPTGERRVNDAYGLTL
jgi:hypothetical protein